MLKPAAIDKLAPATGRDQWTNLVALHVVQLPGSPAGNWNVLLLLAQWQWSAYFNHQWLPLCKISNDNEASSWRVEGARVAGKLKQPTWVGPASSGRLLPTCWQVQVLELSFNYSAVHTRTHSLPNTRAHTLKGVHKDIQWLKLVELPIVYKHLANVCRCLNVLSYIYRNVYGSNTLWHICKSLATTQTPHPHHPLAAAPPLSGAAVAFVCLVI